MNAPTAPQRDRLAEIRARAAAATPGPWHWGGNVDHSCPSLRARRPGLGVVSVLGAVPVARTAQDRGIAGYLEEIHPDERADVLDAYLHDQWGEPIREHRLAFNVDGLLVEARTLPVFEVAPHAGHREDPGVYRADVVGVRHPDAEFIAAARADVDWLIAEVDRLRALLPSDPIATGAIPLRQPDPTPFDHVIHRDLAAWLAREEARAAARPPTALMAQPAVIDAESRTEYL